MLLHQILSLTLLLAATLPVAGQDAALPYSWSNIAPDEGALVAFSEADAKAVSVMDAAGQTLDFYKSDVGEPFLAQYRLAPGTYSATFTDADDPVTFNVKAGLTTYLDLVGVKPTFYSDTPPQFSDAVSKVLATGTAIREPFEIAPVTNVLYFGRNTEPPYPSPFPPPPKPGRGFEN